MNLEYTLFTNRYISYIVSYNSIQTLRFKYHITYLISYELQIWIQPYVYHIIRKYKVRLPIGMQKYISNKDSSYATNEGIWKIKKIAINIEANKIIWKITIL